MQYHLVSLFPEWFHSPLQTALFAKAEKAGLVKVNYVNPRDFTEDKHQKVDDRPYGGGPGMVLMAQPILDAIKSIENPGVIIALTPTGQPLSQDMARELAKEENITLICGRYEGFDERLYELLPIKRVSVGEAILNGGEVAALALIEATARLQEGYMGKNESGDDESFSNDLLEYPHYTRPETFQGLRVPEELLQGNHAHIDAWRRKASLSMTLSCRKELLNRAELGFSDRNYLNSLIKFRRGKNIHIALLHHPVLLKSKISGTSSLTNLDIHDIARISCTYGVASFSVVTPLEDQQNLLKTLVSHWTHGAGAKSNPDRAKALSLVNAAHSLDDVVDFVHEKSGMPPLLLGTTAQAEFDKKGREVRKATSFAKVQTLLDDNAILIVLGTSHGLAPEVLHRCHAILSPIRWAGTYNHLPVRAACAIMLDRLLGDME